ncbi:MAG TPA: hypothetical protein VFM46_06595 [Pseudomonadales bacterium]|nr:hypothetical protein [Pseudomonadales bacterium]
MDMIIGDCTGHSHLIGNGMDYHFRHGQNYTGQRVAQRAIFAPYQTYPVNEVEGMASLVMGGPGFEPGSYFRITQPPQVYQNQLAILADMLGGGIAAGNLALQPLVQG